MAARKMVSTRPELRPGTNGTSPMVLTTALLSVPHRPRARQLYRIFFSHSKTVRQVTWMPLTPKRGPATKGPVWSVPKLSNVSKRVSFSQVNVGQSRAMAMQAIPTS